MALPRYPTVSADHFTCRCGRWCLNSPCPHCEKDAPQPAYRDRQEPTASPEGDRSRR